MAVPQQALDAAKAADELHVKVYGTPEGAPEPEVNGEDPGVNPDDIKPKPSEDDPNSDTWKSRYSALKGKYDKEIKADVKDLTEKSQALEQRIVVLTDRNQSLEGQINKLSGLVEENKTLGEQVKALQLQVDEAKKASETGGRSDTSSIGEDMLSAEEREHLEDADLDGKTMAIIARMQDRALKKGMESVEDRLSKIEGRFETREKEDAQNQWSDYQNTVFNGVGGKEEFDRLNDHPKFFTVWLKEEVPYTGKTRQEIINEHHANQNAAAVVQMFKDFKAWLNEKPAKKDQNRKPYTPPDENAEIEPNGNNISGQDDDRLRGKKSITMAQWNAHNKKKSLDKAYRESKECKQFDALANEVFFGGAGKT